MNKSVLFFEPSIKKVKYRGYDLTNNPVNLALCTSIKKSTYSYYPDNVGIPSIEFIGCNVTWKFKTEKERDHQFDFIANNRFYEAYEN